jgi:hypothetical protein
VQWRGNESREKPLQAAIDAEAQSIEQCLCIRGVRFAALRLHWKSFSDNEQLTSACMNRPDIARVELGNGRRDTGLLCAGAQGIRVADHNDICRQVFMSESET